MRESEIVKKLIDFYRNKKGIFQEIENLLEYQIPSNILYGSKEHANFYFYLIYNDHGTKSINLYDRFKKLFDSKPEVFEARYIVENFLEHEEKFLEEYLSNMGLRYPKQSAKSWVANSKILCDKFDGEALNLYKSTHDALELFKQIKSFRSYGMKTTGLLLRVIKGVKFNDTLENFENVPLPVDTHDSKIALFCNLYTQADKDTVYQSKHIQKISEIWQEAGEKAGVVWEELDRALWLLGSVGCAKKRCAECPIVAFCDFGKNKVNETKNLFNHSSL